MTIHLITRLKRKAWTHALGESSWINRHGDFRTREQYGLIARANYLYGMLRAADVAKYCGKQSVTIIEFGVASGAGLLNIVGLAPMIEKKTAYNFESLALIRGKGYLRFMATRITPSFGEPATLQQKTAKLSCKR